MCAAPHHFPPASTEVIVHCQLRTSFRWRSIRLNMSRLVSERVDSLTGAFFFVFLGFCCREGVGGFDGGFEPACVATGSELESSLCAVFVLSGTELSLALLPVRRDFFLVRTRCDLAVGEMGPRMDLPSSLPRSLSSPREIRSMRSRAFCTELSLLNRARASLLALSA